ncbi:unnamed protein product [Pleuronectes platessa]|uniref:Uncharacterized protein n=1 Tax=Pleuronectes platessa TaxID=8262 RepID=A0A9N7UJM3_PLEPL|nr:unnamed protein product [Pleuronectes platessa]
MWRKHVHRLNCHDHRLNLDSSVQDCSSEVAARRWRASSSELDNIQSGCFVCRTNSRRKATTPCAGELRHCMRVLQEASKLLCAAGRQRSMPITPLPVAGKCLTSYRAWIRRMTQVEIRPWAPHTPQHKSRLGHKRKCLQACL